MNQQKQYIGFAKKYRPGSFKELRGQEVLSKVLSYSVLHNRLAQGYLLTGIRGIGKTTSARIIAKTINCTSPIIAEEDVTPCGVCNNCVAFAEDSHPDILEIDAASKTGVDDIRVIIESSEYKPLLGKYKVFIIDEVHMLSKSAFNALLKVLEEPPPHIIFIFATTEIQKVPATIISRCQRFDLKRFTSKEITELLNQISASENLQIEDSALNIIAHISEGSARDAISLLDQASNLQDHDVITAAVINKLLGRVDLADIIKLVDHIVDQDGAHAIALINNIYQSGVNLELLIISISNFIAYLNKAKLLTEYSEEIYKNYDTEITDILVKTDLAYLSILWQIFSKASSEIKESYNQLIAAEMIIIRAIYSMRLPTTEEVISGKSQFITSSENQKKNQTEEIFSSLLTTDFPQEMLEFLKYLRLSNEMETYYSLMNEVEIKGFANNILEISAKTNDLKFKALLDESLLKWHGKKCEVVITTAKNIISLKQRIIDKIKESKEWEKIKQHFPLVDISDILCFK